MSHMIGGNAIEASTAQTAFQQPAEVGTPSSSTTYPLTAHLENLKSKGINYPATVLLGSTLLILSATTYTGYRIGRGRQSTQQALQSANAATYRLALRKVHPLRNVPAGITALQNDIAALRSEHDSLAWSLSATPVSDVFNEVSRLREMLQGFEDTALAQSADAAQIKEALAALQVSVNEVQEGRKALEAGFARARDGNDQAKEEIDNLRRESELWRAEVLDGLKSLQGSIANLASKATQLPSGIGGMIDSVETEQADTIPDEWASSSSVDELPHQDMGGFGDTVSEGLKDEASTLDSPLHASFGYNPPESDSADEMASSFSDAPKRGRPRGSKRRIKPIESEIEAEKQDSSETDERVAQDTTHPFDPSYEARQMTMRWRAFSMGPLPRRPFPFQ